MKNKGFLVLAALLMTMVATTVFANATEGEHAGIPGRDIFWQFFNLSIIFAVLFYNLKQTVVDFFKDRASVYLEAAKKSQSAKLDAEKQYLDIKHKLEHLENSHAENLVRAEAEAADLRKQLLREADELALRVQRETQEAIILETSKTREEVKNAFIQETLQAARNVLTKDIGAQDHQRLQAHFSQTVQEVQP